MTVDEVRQNENRYHLQELRDRIAGEIFARAVFMDNELSLDVDIVHSVSAANAFVRYLAANPFTLEGKS